MKRLQSSLLLTLVALLVTGCNSGGGHKGGGGGSNKFTVSFEAFNGESIAPVKVEKGATIIAPENPRKDGQDFLYWVTDDLNVFDFNTPIEGDLTLSAAYQTSSDGSSELSLSDSQREIYESHYGIKRDCHGHPIGHYNFTSLTKNNLQGEIHDYLIDQHHRYFKYSRELGAGVFQTIDKIPNSDKMENFYTAKQADKYSSGSVTGKHNKEHVWPCANSTGLWYRSASYWEYLIDTNTNYWGGGSDLFHIRPCEHDVNEHRGNAKFYSFTSSETKYEIGEDGGTYKIKVDAQSRPNKVEVADAFKGDVARIIMYIYVHYRVVGSRFVYYSNNESDPSPVYNLDEAIHQGTGSDDKEHTPHVCGNLSLRNIFQGSSESASIQLLKSWNAIDPVSEIERQRNDVIESQYQGNRNPFVDFPELIDRCF